jgi:DedD protein
VNSLLHRDSEDEEHDAPQGDREITLGTTMILAIFFALAVFAAVFFGFGYSMGSKRAAAVPISGDPAMAVQSGASTAKPGAGNASNGSAPTAASDNEPKQASAAAGSTSAAAGSTSAAAGSTSAAPASTSAEAASTSSSALQRIVSTVHSQAVAQGASPAEPALPIAQQPVVQIAAVSHQQDADLLVSTLKRRGYNVTIHTDPHDKLLHVQVGPFATRPEAQAMRQRLIGDGFNAIVKDPIH